MNEQSLNARYSTEDEADRASSEYRRQIGELEEELNMVESVHLRKRAERFGIDLVNAVGPWMTHAVIPGRMWLEEREQAKARRVISDARFEWWKKWIGLVSPVASVLIALMAFVLAGVALYLQVTGKLPHPVAPVPAQQESPKSATH